MPAGKALIRSVAEMLPADGIGVTSNDIATKIHSTVTKRALRYALKRLVDRGIASRRNDRHGRRLYLLKASPHCVSTQPSC